MLNLEHSRDNDTARVAASGELDIYSAPELSDVIDGYIDAGVKEVVLDLSGIEFLDSTGLSAFLAAHQRLESEGGSLVLEGPGALITRMFDLTGLTEHFVIKFPKR
ncbi:MAG TPA: STAS domain-containing protein [Nocardioidaceae bacterium]|nr:STAS domain-containing protein [Nocardioidaceae bacterium]